MIQCVGCRQEDRNYCARVCCSQAVKNALKLKAAEPADGHLRPLPGHADLRVQEDYYREAADKDVTVHPLGAAGQARGGGRRRRRAGPCCGSPWRTLSWASGSRSTPTCSSLSAAVVPAAGSQEVGRLFKVALSPDGFFQEAHVKLRPVDFAADGVFLCGTAHYPKHIPETINQAYGAAGRALTLLSQDTVTASGSVCEVNENDCVSCGACITACTYGAIEFRRHRRGQEGPGQPGPLQGRRPLQRQVPDGRRLSLKHFTDEEICWPDRRGVHGRRRRTAAGRQETDALRTDKGVETE